MEIAMAGLMIGGAVLNTVGNLKEANAKADAMEYNAARSDDQAWQVKEKAEADEAVSRYETTKTLGTIRASYGASGVTMDGTPHEYMANQSAVGEANALAIKHQGILQAKAYTDEADNLRKSAKATREAGVWQAVGTGISGATTLLKRT